MSFVGLLQIDAPRASSSRAVSPRRLIVASWTVLLVALGAFLALTAWRGRLLHIDDVFYKAAGYHWSADGHFAAPELAGRLHWDPPIETVFACYPPVYPFAFGVYTQAAGFGWRQVALFDALLHALLCLVTAAAVLRTYRITSPTNLPSWLPHLLACVAALMVLPLGTIGRPDELAMLFGMGAVLLSMQRLRADRTAFLGVLWGLCAGTSVGTAIIFTPMIVMLMWASRRSARNALLHLGAICVAAALVFAACWVPLLRIHPQAFRQFIEHSRDNLHEHPTILAAWSQAFRAGTQLMLTMSGLTFTALLVGVICWRAGLLKQWSLLLGSALLGILLTFVSAKGKGTYLWFVGPWMIAVTLVLFATCWKHVSTWFDRLDEVLRAPVLFRAAVAAIILAPMLLTTLLAGSMQCAQWLGVAILPPGQTPADAQAVLDRLVPDGAVVLADELWPQLAQRCKVYDATFSLYDRPAKVLDQVQYVVLTANNSSHPGERKRLRRAEFERYLDQHFEVVHDQAGEQQLSILGSTVKPQAQGFGPVVLRRREESLRFTSY